MKTIHTCLARVLSWFGSRNTVTRVDAMSALNRKGNWRAYLLIHVTIVTFAVEARFTHAVRIRSTAQRCTYEQEDGITIAVVFCPPIEHVA